MNENDTARLLTAIERIADALESIAQRPERRPRQAASETVTQYADHLERLIEHRDSLIGRMTMEEILAVLGLADQDNRGTRLSVGVALSRLGIRKVRSAQSRAYEFAQPGQTAFE